MAAPLETTRTQGVYKRGSRYVVRYRDAQGRSRQESARTYAAACELRKRRQSDVQDGTYQPATRETLAEYAREWIDRYQGNGRRGFTEETRVESRRDLEKYALPHLGRLRLEHLTPRQISGFVAWLCDENAQGERRETERRERLAAKRGVPVEQVPASETVEPVHLADATVRRIVSPLRSCLRTATAEGVLRANPAAEIVFPSRDEDRRIADGTDEDDESDVRPFTDAQLAAVLAAAPPRHALMFRVLAQTGLRIGEVVALEWRDLQLTTEPPTLRVRQSYAWRGKRMKPPKSRHGRRTLPIGDALAGELREHYSAAFEATLPDDADAATMERAATELRAALVFPSDTGTVLDYRNLLTRSMKPAAEQAGAPWAGFHTFRHTAGSMLIAQGRSIVQVSRWLGHHSPAFTLQVYAHLMNGDLGGPLALPGVTPSVTETTRSAPNAPAGPNAVAPVNTGETAPVGANP